MATKNPASSLPTELRTERLVLRPVDGDSDADCLKANYIRCNVSGGAKDDMKEGAKGIYQIRYKHKVHGPKQEFCTFATAPPIVYWFMWLPPAEGEMREMEDLSNLAGFIAMSFREEMPYPDMGYAVVASHAGHGYASEAGKEVLYYWRDLVGVKEIFVGCPEGNRKSQRCAERIGFVRGGPMMF